MKFKRDEPFRYSFGTPLPCTYQLIVINGQERKTSLGEGEILDISLSGLKLKTSLNIPLNDHLEIEISLMISESPITLRGKFVWQKNNYSDYWYGVQFQADEETHMQLISDLKNYSKNHLEKAHM